MVSTYAYLESLENSTPYAFGGAPIVCEIFK